jgi:hypothetical protein
MDMRRSLTELSAAGTASSLAKELRTKATLAQFLRGLLSKSRQKLNKSTSLRGWALPLQGATGGELMSIPFKYKIQPRLSDTTLREYIDYHAFYSQQRFLDQQGLAFRPPRPRGSETVS